MKKLIRKPGFILLLLSVAGFIFTTSLKKQKQVFFKKYYNQEINEGYINVGQSEKYIFAFSTTDEESEGFTQWPLAEAHLIIVDNEGVELVNDTIVDGGFVNVGVKRAMVYEQYEINVEKNGRLNFKCLLINGDECELEIYKNLEDWKNMLPALFIVGFVIGVFWTLRKKQN